MNAPPGMKVCPGATRTGKGVVPAHGPVPSPFRFAKPVITGSLTFHTSLKSTHHQVIVCWTVLFVLPFALVLAVLSISRPLPLARADDSESAATSASARVALLLVMTFPLPPV